MYAMNDVGGEMKQPAECPRCIRQKARRLLFRLAESDEMERSLWAIGHVAKFLWLCMPTIKSEPDAPYIMRNSFVDLIVKCLKVVSREEFQMDKSQSFASELFLGTLPQHSFANNKMDFATFTSAMWVLTKFFVSASSAWQVRAVWLAKVANRTTRRVEDADPNIDAGIFGSLGDWHDEYGNGAGVGFYDCEDVAMFYPIEMPLEIVENYEYMDALDDVVSDPLLKCAREQGAGGIAGPEEGRIFETGEMAEWEDGAWMESEEALELEDEEEENHDVTPGSSGWNSKAASFDGSRPGTSDSAGRELRELDRYSKGLFDEKGKMMGGWSPWGRDTPPLMLRARDEAQGAGHSRSRSGVNARRGGGQGPGQGRGAQGMSRGMENGAVARQELRTAQVLFTLKERQRPKSVAGVAEARMMGDAASGGGGGGGGGRGRGADVGGGAGVERHMQAARALASYAEEARARAQARGRGAMDGMGGSSMMGGGGWWEAGEGRAGVEGPLDLGGNDMWGRGQGHEGAAGRGKGGWEEGTAGHGLRSGARQAGDARGVPTGPNWRGARQGAPQEHRGRGADTDAGFPRVGVRSFGGTSEGGSGGLHLGRHVWNQGRGMRFVDGVQESAGPELASVHSSRVLHIELGPRPESVKKLRRRLNLCHRHVVHAPKTPGVDGSVDGSVQMASIQPMARGQTHNATKAVADADAEVEAVAGRNHANAAAAQSGRANDGGRNDSSAAAAKSERANDGGGGSGGRSKVPVEVTGVGAKGAGGELTPFSHSRWRQSRGGSGRGWHMNGRVIKRSVGLDEFAHLGQDSPIVGPWAPNLGKSFLSASLV